MKDHSKYSWSKTHIFAALTITQYWLDNTIIINFFFLTMQPLFTGWKRQMVVFLRIANKAPVRIQQNLYTAFDRYDKAIYKISFFSDKCFVRKWRIKFQVSKYCLRWNIENWQVQLCLPKKLPFLRLEGKQLVCSTCITQL